MTVILFTWETSNIDPLFWKVMLYLTFSGFFHCIDRKPVIFLLPVYLTSWSRTCVTRDVPHWDNYFHQVWTRSTCLFLAYNVFTAGALRHAVTLTFDSSNLNDELRDVGQQASGRDTWTVNRYFECSLHCKEYLTRKRGNCECIATWGSPTPRRPYPL